MLVRFWPAGEMPASAARNFQYKKPCQPEFNQWGMRISFLSSRPLGSACENRISESLMLPVECTDMTVHECALECISK